MPADPVVCALADLRHRWLQASAAYPGGPSALAEVARRLDALVSAGTLRTLHDDQGRLLAAVLLAHLESDPFYLAPTTHLVAHHDGSAPALAWLDEALAAVGPTPPDDIECAVPAADAATRRLLAARGLGVSTVMLVGRVQTARSALAQRWAPPPDLAHLGLTLDRVQPEEAGVVVDLVRRVYREEPDYAWFMAGQDWLERLHALVTEVSPHAVAYLVRDGARALGLLEADHNLDDPQYGTAVGFGLTLDRQLRGKRVAPVFYGRELHRATRAGVEWVKGSTARRAVLHMAEVMGRQPVLVHMRRRPRFDDGRFDALLAAAARPRPAPATSAEG